jgi:hypothetical protein
VILAGAGIGLPGQTNYSAVCALYFARDRIRRERLDDFTTAVALGIRQGLSR